VPEAKSAPVEEQEKYLEEVGYKRRQVWRSSTTEKGSVQEQRLGRDDRDEEVENEDVENDDLTETGQNYSFPGQTFSGHQLQERSLGTSSQSYHPESITYQRKTNTNTSTSASLYERTQNNLNKRAFSQENPVSAYGDPPLQEFDTSFLFLPSKDKAHALVTKYFDVVSATNRILHRPTVETWTCELFSDTRSIQTGSEKNSQRAVVLMVFALMHRYMDGERSEWERDIG